MQFAVPVYLLVVENALAFPQKNSLKTVTYFGIFFKKLGYFLHNVTTISENFSGLSAFQWPGYSNQWLFGKDCAMVIKY